MSSRTRLGGRSLARLSIASKELLRSYPEKAGTIEALTAFSGEILGALSDICTHLHSDFPDFCAADYFIELAGHVRMKSSTTDAHEARLKQTVNYLRDMARWMGTDGMRGLTTGKPLGRQLTEIYDAVVSRVPKKVFLARWYPGVKDGEQQQIATNRYEALKLLVEGEMKMQLVDLANKDGGTYPIHQTMYDQINISDIFIADLTGLRPNVMIELGYALRDHQPGGRMLLIFNAIAGVDKVPFDTNTFRYESIGEVADIPNALRKHLNSILDDAKAGNI